MSVVIVKLDSVGQTCLFIFIRSISAVSGRGFCSSFSNKGEKMVHMDRDKRVMLWDMFHSFAIRFLALDCSSCISLDIIPVPKLISKASNYN